MSGLQASKATKKRRNIASKRRQQFRHKLAKQVADKLYPYASLKSRRDIVNNIESILENGEWI